MTIEWEEDPVEWKYAYQESAAWKPVVGHKKHYAHTSHQWWCLGDRIGWYSLATKQWRGKLIDDSTGYLTCHVMFKDKRSMLEWILQANFTTYGCTLFGTEA